jgi:hypothetical protein
MPSSQFILWIEHRLSESVGSNCRRSDTRLAEMPGARTAERAGPAVEPPGGAEGARSSTPLAASPWDRVRALAFTIEETDNVRTAEAPME